MRILLLTIFIPFLSFAQNIYSPKGSNYEVSFFNNPKISEVNTENTSFERAEAANEDCYLRAESVPVTEELNKQETISYLNEFAKLEGLKNTTVTFENTSQGNMGYLIGYKNMDTPNGNKSVKHLIKIYSKESSCIILYAMLISSSYPKEVQAFFNSIKYKK